MATVFAGADIEATERARSYFQPHRASSPQIALLQKGRVVYMLQREEIMEMTAEQIAASLAQAFDRFCTAGPAQASAS
jgi:putative YphP/YqiW family bacilliredoxin